MPQRLFGIWSCVLLGCWSTPARAADEATWVGKLVMSKATGVKLLEQPAADSKSLGNLNVEPIKVDRVEKGFLQVRQLDRSGWVEKEKMVLAEEAVPYFTGASRRMARTLMRTASARRPGG